MTIASRILDVILPPTIHICRLMYLPIGSAQLAIISAGASGVRRNQSRRWIQTCVATKVEQAL